MTVFANPMESTQLAPWLGRETPAQSQIAVRRALCDVFIRELSGTQPNRGARIDSYNAAAGVALGSPYCASALTAWWRYANFDVPPRDPAFWRSVRKPAGGPASVDHWWWWALATGRVAHGVSQVRPGFAVAYGHGADDNPGFHIELVIRITPELCAFGANTTRKGTASREGDAFDRRWIDRLGDPNLPILGFISPTPL